MSDSSRVGIYYIKETAWGAIPASALTEMRYVSESLKASQETVVSAEVRSDRQVPDLVRVAAEGGGDVNVEFSYGTYDVFLEAALMAAWQTDVPVVGTDRLENGTVLQSFTLEKQFQDVSEFLSFSGMRVAGFSLAAAPRAVMTGSFSFLGLNGVAAGATVGTGAPVAAGATEVFNAVDHITAINEGGGAIANVLRLELNVDNALRSQPILGQLSPSGIGAGTLSVSGRLQAYFATRALYEKYLNFTATSLDFTITDQAGNEYKINLPRIKYGDGDLANPGKDQDIIADLSFTAFRDPTTGKTIQIERNPA